MHNPVKVSRVVLLSLAFSLAASAQPRAAVAPPDAAMVERWLQQACGVGRPADAAWGAAHVRLPVAIDECSGEARRRCRHRSERNAAAALSLACEANVVGDLRRGTTFAAWSAELDGRHFTARGARRRVDGGIGQFGRVLVMVTDASHEATLVAVDDR